MTNTGPGAGAGRTEDPAQLTVTRRQCRSRASAVPWASSGSPSSCARRCMPDTRTMSMSLSQQKDWMSVKWICRAMSPSSSSSMAKRHRTTLSGSLRGQRKGTGQPRVWGGAAKLPAVCKNKENPQVCMQLGEWGWGTCTFKVLGKGR